MCYVLQDYVMELVLENLQKFQRPKLKGKQFPPGTLPFQKNLDPLNKTLLSSLWLCVSNWNKKLKINVKVCDSQVDVFKMIQSCQFALWFFVHCCLCRNAIFIETCSLIVSTGHWERNVKWGLSCSIFPFVHHFSLE